MIVLLREALHHLREHNKEYHHLTPLNFIERMEKSIASLEQEEVLAKSGELWIVSKDRLKEFMVEAKKLSFNDDDAGQVRSVTLKDVRRLLFNLASGRRPSEMMAPTWSNKDCVGCLLRRGWKFTDDYSGMHRRGYFIPYAAIINSGIGGPESTADTLEIEFAVRTDRPDE